MPAWQVSLALMIALVFDAFVDPFVGHMSDRTRTKWGRRHPFLYASALPVALFYLLLWNPPDIDGSLLFAYLLGTAFLVRAALSTYEVPSTALAPELTSDYHERTSVLSFRHLFRLVRRTRHDGDRVSISAGPNARSEPMECSIVKDMKPTL